MFVVNAVTKPPTPAPLSYAAYASNPAAAPIAFPVAPMFPSDNTGCGDLNVLYDENLQKGLYLWGNGSQPGDSITFECWGQDAHGNPFRLIGPKHATCQEDLEWSAFPTCQSESK